MNNDLNKPSQSNEEWTEEQDKAYWEEVAQRREKREKLRQAAIEYLNEIGPEDIAVTIAEAKGYKGELYEEFEWAPGYLVDEINQFLAVVSGEEEDRPREQSQHT